MHLYFVPRCSVNDLQPLYAGKGKESRGKQPRPRPEVEFQGDPAGNGRPVEATFPQGMCGDTQRFHQAVCPLRLDTHTAG